MSALDGQSLAYAKATGRFIGLRHSLESGVVTPDQVIERMVEIERELDGRLLADTHEQREAAQ